MRATVAKVALSLLAAACGGAHANASSKTGPGTVPTAPPIASNDALGPRPSVPTPPPFAPPAAVVYKNANGLTVWLFERHTLPIVSFAMSIPSGSSADPAEKGGLASATAGMLDEGAGSRDALKFAAAVDTLGATLSTGSDPDSSFVSLLTLKKNLKDSFALLADAVAHPRFDDKEWKRVHELWVNDLKARAKEPNATARVAIRAALFGVDATASPKKPHPYAHPPDGTVESAVRVGLQDVKTFYRANWRPDRATLVAVGDITRAELDPIIDAAFGKWKAPATPAPEPVAPAAPPAPKARLVVVDRPEAPQSIIAAVRPGVAASDPSWPALGRVNVAVGGSFTSRLNQDLREERGFSYGAHSYVTQSRGVGAIVASAAVYTEKTGDALKAMLSDLQGFAAEGLTDDEVSRTRSQARAETVELFESVGSIAGQLASNAALGLPADFESRASVARDEATASELNQLAKNFDPKGAIVVIVGPYAQIKTQLDPLGFGTPEMRDASGEVIPMPTPPKGPSKANSPDRDHH